MVLEKINKKLLPMKAHFFLFNAGTGPVVPFLPTLAKQLGLSTVIVGYIYTFLPICGMIAKPTLGAIADRFHCQRSLFLLSMLIACLGFFSISFVPPIVIHSQVHLSCEGGTVFFIPVNNNSTYCENELLKKQINEKNFTISCDMTCMSENASHFDHEICHHWGNSAFCTKDLRIANEISDFKPEKFDKKNSGLIGKSSNVAVKRHDSQHKVARYVKDIHFLSFRGEIDSYYIEEIESVLHLPIKRAYFSSENYYVPNCQFHVAATCQIKCNDYLVTEMVSKVTDENTKLSSGEILAFYEFWLFFILLVISWISMAAVISIGDAICFELLGDKPENYGLQRLWGAVGWGLLSILAGYLVDIQSEGRNIKDYTPVFYLCGVILIFDVIVSSRIKVVQSKLSSNILKDVGQLLRDVRVVVFLFWCIAIGMCTALVWHFLFLFLEELASESGCDSRVWIKTLQGISMGIQCFGGELPFFFLSGRILQKLGHVHSMSLVLIAFGVRFLLYSLLSNPWYSLPIELLNGLTFGIFYVTMPSYASIIAPPGTEASVQGVVGAVFEGIGISMGSLIAGIISNLYGGAVLFRIFGIGCCLLFVLHVLVQKLIETKYQRRSPKKVIATNAIYTSPTEAIHMLENEHGDSLS